VSHPILLIAAGPRQHTPALQRAFDLARSAELPVHVAVFAYDALLDARDPFAEPDVCALARREVVAEHQAWVDALAARWRADGLDASGTATWAPVTHAAILALAAKLQPALIVKDVGHEPLLRRVTYTALDWKLLRQAPAPLMLVDGRSSRAPRKLLAAIDTTAGSPDAEALNARVLREALKLADWSDADVAVAHVFPYPSAYGAPGAYRALERLHAEARSADRAAFTAFAAAHQVPPEACHWLEGDPVQRLIDLVHAHGVDVLVLGSSYHSGWERLLLGSTAENMLYRAPCDALLVKPADFAASHAQEPQQRAA
jgi:universal stress protein E